MDVKLLTPAFVAAALGIKPQSLRLRRMKGQGPPFIRLSDSPTARAYYPEAEFLAWIAARPLRTSTAEEKRDSERSATPQRSKDVTAIHPTVAGSVAETLGRDDEPS